MTKIKKEIDKSPIFYYNNDTSYELKAGGVLFYKYNKEEDKYEFLMINSRNQYEDFGGKTDVGDENIIKTISREVDEESNKIFSKEIIEEKIKNLVTVYVKHCKYLLYFVELTDNYNPLDFGKKEHHDNLNRTVEWVGQENFYKEEFIKNLNFRLRIFNVLENIKNLFQK